MGYTLITGGLGYIGSHIACLLLTTGYQVIIVDNCSNSSPQTLDVIHQITGKTPIFYEFDLRSPKLDIIFREYQIDAVIHLAGLKSVNESLSYPLVYYNNNVTGTLNLLMVMAEYKVKKLIFSSSVTVYGNSPSPLTESSPIGKGITNSYGESKFIIETILKSLIDSDPEWNIISLRYANPMGSHSSHLLGDNPIGIPHNLMPYLTRVAYHHNIHKISSEYETLKIFGTHLNTVDGTCVRDIIHIEDLAQAHISALQYSNLGYHVFNVGTGKGVTVLEIVNVFMRVNNVKLPYEIVASRQGDVPIVYFNTDLIKKELNWHPLKNLVDICLDAWSAQKQISLF